MVDWRVRATADTHAGVQRNGALLTLYNPRGRNKHAWKQTNNFSSRTLLRSWIGVLWELLYTPRSLTLKISLGVALSRAVSPQAREPPSC